MRLPLMPCAVCALALACTDTMAPLDPNSAIVARINGVPFASRELPDWPIASLDTARTGLSITGGTQRTGGRIDFITLQLPHYRGPGRYVLCNESVDSAYAFYVHIESDTTPQRFYFPLAPCGDGVVIVRALSRSDLTVDGTFAFTGRPTSYSDDVVKVTDGAFRGALYIVPPAASERVPSN